MLKSGKRKIVIAYGSFDGLHPGNLAYLKAARKLGKVLVVAVARDNSALPKFERRFGLPEDERKNLVESLNIADKVLLGGLEDPLEKAKEIRPDIIAYTKYHPVEKRVLESELQTAGLKKTKVVLLKPYKPKIYDKILEKEWAV